MKQITIKVPDNFELKQDDNTYSIIEKEKKLSYEDIIRELFPKDSSYYYISSGGTINKSLSNDNLVGLPNNTTSKKQAEKLLAINKLMNVAKYLNGDWQPDWNNHEELKFFINYSIRTKELYIDFYRITPYSSIVFKSQEFAKQAIEILGEETIKLALCTDY